MPDMYARIYHDAYTFIKGIDPTARVAIGPIVQPTPLRLQYLDMVQSAYSAMYSSTMPIDVFNAHAYVIDEVHLKPGADIPPGINVITGTLFTKQQHLDADVFGSLTRNLRIWMKKHGYQNVPLIITEYGALYPLWHLEEFGLTQSDIDHYITNVNNWIVDTHDANLGYPPDDHRLVQQAAIYSLDDDSIFTNMITTFVPYRWGSFLFDSTPPYTRTATGNHFREMASNMPPTVDLRIYRATISPTVPIISSTETITPIVKALLANSGDSNAPFLAIVRFTDVINSYNIWISDVTLSSFPGCGTLKEASIVWPQLGPGLHRMRIEIDPFNQIVETNESNNIMTVTVVIRTPNSLYLPIIFH